MWPCNGSKTEERGKRKETLFARVHHNIIIMPIHKLKIGLDTRLPTHHSISIILYLQHHSQALSGSQLSHAYYGEKIG